MTGTPDLAALAERLQSAADGDAGMLALAAGLRRAVDAERPGAVIAKALGMPANRRSPARLAREQAFAKMAACQRYAGLKGKRLYVAMLRDLTRYAVSAAWSVDRRQARSPYLAADWHDGAWQALKLDAMPPQHWKTLGRAVVRGQFFVVHG